MSASVASIAVFITLHLNMSKIYVLKSPTHRTTR